MLTKTVTFPSLADPKQNVEVELRFHLYKHELLELDSKYNGGLAEELKRAEGSNNNSIMFNLFTELILNSYGVPVKDPVLGEVFTKTPEATANFKNSPAFDAVFLEITKTVEDATKFFNAVANLDLL